MDALYNVGCISAADNVVEYNKHNVPAHIIS